MKSPDKNESTVRSLDKALDILEHMSRVRGEVDLASLARQTRIPKPTLLRLIHTLKRHNFIQQNHPSQKYQIGWAFIYFGKIASDVYTLPKVIHPFLEQLGGKTGETVSLVVLDQDHAVYIDQVISRNMIKGIPTIGSKLGLHCTSAGKMLLSTFKDEDLENFLRSSVLEKKTEKTISDPSALKEEIRKIKRQGYAVDDEETEMGGRCVSAPILEKEGKTVAAISIIGPTNRIRKEDLGRLSAIVKETAYQASAALGHEGRG
jgi:IclR family transcriptional regulator, KDG regulon repressor